MSPPSLIVRMNIPDNLTIVRIIFPLSFPSLVVTSPPRMSPSLPRRYRHGRKKGCKATLQHVRVAANGMRGVAVLGTVAMKAEVASGRDKECFKEITLCKGVDVPGGRQGISR